MDNVTDLPIQVPGVAPDAPLGVRVPESEVEFRLLADAIPQMVWITRLDGSNVYFNHRWVEYTGLTLEQSGDGWNTPSFMSVSVIPTSSKVPTPPLQKRWKLAISNQRWRFWRLFAWNV